jgi:O-antigen/teichoic acid export membrane protein
MLKKWKRLCTTAIVQNVAVLSGGTAMSQALTILSLPVLARLYHPGDFGLYAVYTSTVNMGAAAMSLQYEQAVVLPKEDTDAACLAVLALGIVGILSISVFALLLLFQQTVAKLLGNVKILGWLWIVPVNLAAIGAFQVLLFWFVRHRFFKRIAVIRIIQTAIMIGIQISTAWLFYPEAAGLIIGFVVAQVTAVMVMAGCLVKDNLITTFKGISFGRMLSQAVIYRKYPLYSSWMFVIDRFKIALPVLFFTRFFGADVAGLYSMTTRILYLPSNLVGRAVSRVLFQQVAEEKNKSGHIGPLIERSFRWLLSIGFIYLMGTIILSFFFGLILGQEWLAAGPYARVLAPAFALMFSVSAISFVLGATNRQELEAIWQITSLVILMVFLSISLFFAVPIYALVMLSVSYVVIYSFYSHLILRSADAKYSQVFRIRWSGM